MAELSWINRDEYPFESHYFELDPGRMHYVDEGQGSPVVMVHGTPTWSFLYRDLIKELSRSHRVVAVDHIGFGLSDKPEAYSYRPEELAQNLTALIEQLNLRDITLVVHDFGGPIGLSYAIDHPGNVKALVLFNTWMWSLQGNSSVKMASRLLGNPIGRFLYKRMNFSPRMLMKAAMGDKSKLTKEIHQHYINVFPEPQDRQAPWTFARELLGSSNWYDRLWQQRERIKDKPTLILWGMKDPTFSASDLERWAALFTDAEIVKFPEAGHFVPEEEEGNLAPIVERFLECVNQSV